MLHAIRPSATQAVILGAVGNSLTKATIALTLGSPTLRKQTAWVIGLSAALGIATLWFV